VTGGAAVSVVADTSGVPADCSAVLLDSHAVSTAKTNAPARTRRDEKDATEGRDMASTPVAGLLSSNLRGDESKVRDLGQRSGQSRLFVHREVAKGIVATCQKILVNYLRTSPSRSDCLILRQAAIGATPKFVLKNT
jgi:hypothetical protein